MEDHDLNSASAFIRYGVSDEFSALLQGLRETPGLAGPKFRPRDVDGVARSLLCRNYGFSCLELSYLLTAVQLAYPDGSGAPLLSFFWVDEAITPSRCRLAFAEDWQEGHSSVSVTEAGLRVVLDADEYTISLSRIGELAVLFEFLVNLKPDLALAAIDNGVSVSTKSVQSFASEVQSLIYNYLAEHSKPAQQQKRFRFLWSWLVDRDLSVDRYSIDDALILKFWVAMASSAEGEKLGFRRYRSAVEDFIALLDAVDVGDTMAAMYSSASLGYESEQGEISPDQLQSALATLPDTDNYSWLNTSPKFLTAKSLAILSPMLELNSAIDNLSLTLLRHRTFGDWQAQILQALRNKTADRLEQLLTHGPQQDYLAWLDTLVAAKPDMERSMLAGLQVLLELETPEAITLLLDRLPPAAVSRVRELLPELDFHSLGELLQCHTEQETEQMLSSVDQLNYQFYRQLTTLSLQTPELNQILRESRAAYKNNNREGFRELPAPAAVGPYIAAIEALKRIIDLIENYQTQLFQELVNSAGIQKKYVSDLSIFREVIYELYGDAS